MQLFLRPEDVILILLVVHLFYIDLHELVRLNVGATVKFSLQLR